jgi:hypothetical protein
MNKLLLSLLCALALFACITPCFADTVNGVLAEERVVNLPQDAGKWYVSVVGDATSARYQEVLGWFNTDPNLKKLTSQVHLLQVTTGTAIYKERYQPNVKGLPTVRMQKADGTVVYEAAGKNIPMTAAGLYGAMASAAQTAQGIRPILPWRRNMENRCPGPQPAPNPTPDPTPDEPVPDDGGAPIFDQPAPDADPYLFLAPALVGALVLGLGLGYGRKLFDKIHPTGK